MVVRLGKMNVAGATPVGRATVESRLAEGAILYQQYCAICHGANGDGNGSAAFLLDPRPRDFRLGKYRLVSSGNQIPFKHDIIHTIRNGMAGTSMPSWIQLGDRDIELLADYVWSITRDAERERLSARLLAQKRDLKKLDVLLQGRVTASSPATLGPEPKATPQDLEKIKPIFMEACAKCHGADGAGMQDPAWRTDEGHPIASRNFRSGIFKGGGRARDIYLRIYGGIPGTPMPGFGSSFSDEDIWRLVHYTKHLAQPTTLSGAPDPGNHSKGSN